MGHALDGARAAGRHGHRRTVSPAHRVYPLYHAAAARGYAGHLAALLWSWRETTRDRSTPALLELMPALARLTPPATVIDKTRYSAFFEPQLLQHLRRRSADGLIVTGSETDVCVLATVLGAVDQAIA